MIIILLILFPWGCTGEIQREVICIELTSTAFQQGGTIPAKYTCDGEDLVPPLQFNDIPAETKSLVLIMDDPDAPAGTWDHWVLFNIPPTTLAIEEGQDLEVHHGKNSWGNTRWQGPCPPDREHRYHFTLYALDTTLDLPEGSTKLRVEQAMTNHILAEATLMGKYNRPQNE